MSGTGFYGSNDQTNSVKALKDRSTGTCYWVIMHRAPTGYITYFFVSDYNLTLFFLFSLFYQTRFHFYFSDVTFVRILL